MKIGINGMGRIGKCVYRIMRERGYKVPIINDPGHDVDSIIYTLVYDTVSPSKEKAYKKGDNEFSYRNDMTVITNFKNPEEIPWRTHEVDIVIESSGFFLKSDECMKHIKAGAKKVIITAPSPDAKMIVMGVNQDSYGGEKVISNASCTTNCLAPIAKILHDEYTILEGLMTTIHAATATQRVVDGVTNKKKRLERSAANIIPSSTGAAKAVGKVIPELQDKLTGTAFRVPVLNVSVVDLTIRTQNETSMEEITSLLKSASSGKMRGILSYTEDQLVSSDFNGNEHSSIYDAKASMQLNSRFFKIISWYDNEYGYSCRVVDLAEFISRKVK